MEEVEEKDFDDFIESLNQGIKHARAAHNKDMVAVLQSAVSEIKSLQGKVVQKELPYEAAQKQAASVFLYAILEYSQNSPWRNEEDNGA